MKEYPIDDLPLGKWLSPDFSMKNMEPSIHNFTTLESCIDRQLANVFRVAEETSGVDRWDIKLFTKLTPHFEHRVHTTCRISNVFYGRCYDLIWGLGQGMISIGSNNRNMQCLMFKILEEK